MNNINYFLFPLVTLNVLNKKKSHKGNRSIGAFYLSYLVLDLHVFQLVFQLRERWSYIRVILPAFQHYLIPTIEIIIIFMNIGSKILIAIATESF